MTHEFRQNKITKQWVIYAPGRGDRPKDFPSGDQAKRDRPAYDPDCPFCPGNEDHLPDIITEIAGPDG